MKARSITATLAASAVLSAAGAASALYVHAGGLWPRGVPIPVCFVNPSAENEKVRQWTREAVEDEWEDNANLTFTGWGKCTPDATGIAVSFDDSCPGGSCSPNAGVGKPGSGTVGIKLLRTYEKHWRAYQCAPNKIGHERCTREYAVHEFGHALGFWHEQDRPETPASCSSKGPPIEGAATYGAYDDKSVMNYCATPRLGGGVLSAADIKAVRQIYGEPPARSRSLARKAKKTAFHAAIRIEGWWTYTTEQAKAAAAEARDEAKAILDRIKAAFGKAGSAIVSAAKKAGSALENAANKAKEKLKSVFKK